MGKEPQQSELTKRRHNSFTVELNGSRVFHYEHDRGTWGWDLRLLIRGRGYTLGRHHDLLTFQAFGYPRKGPA